MCLILRLPYEVTLREISGIIKGCLVVTRSYLFKHIRTVTEVAREDLAKDGPVVGLPRDVAVLCAEHVSIGPGGRVAVVYAAPDSVYC